MLDRVDYIWISHEHPDHCHFPTLDSFPASFKSRVTILFQDRDYTKMFAAFRKLGYRHFNDWRTENRTAVRTARRDESLLLPRRPDGLGAGGPRPTASHFQRQ